MEEMRISCSKSLSSRYDPATPIQSCSTSPVLFENGNMTNRLARFILGITRVTVSPASVVMDTVSVAAKARLLNTNAEHLYALIIN